MLRRKCKSHPSSTNLDKLIVSQLAVQKLMAEAKAILENNLINELASNNSSMIYKYIHRQRKNYLIPPALFLDNISVSTDRGKAELFNKYFHSVLTRSMYNLPLADSLSTPFKC